MTTARELHEAYERLAPKFGYETRADTKVFDPESPNGRLMQAAIDEVFGRALDLLARVEESEDELVRRLSGYNPPDRTIDSQRQIAIDIHDAAAAIVALRAENEALRKDSDFPKGTP